MQIEPSRAAEIRVFSPETRAVICPLCPPWEGEAKIACGEGLFGEKMQMAFEAAYVISNSLFFLLFS